MAKGNFGGMPGNMGSMMKQMQKMQKQMEDMQKELDDRVIETTSGGGAVKATMNGKRELLDLIIDEEIDYKNVELLKRFLSDKGRINPARVTGADAKLQRKITRAIKRARNVALLPYTRRTSR